MALLLKAERPSIISSRWKGNFGGDFYAQYLRMRLKLLGAHVYHYGTDHKIEYTKTERGRPERLIFLPGFADTKENFYNAAQFLVQDYDMIIPDLPGFGRSFKRKGERYNLKNYALWLHDFIMETGWTDFHLAGNSLGGGIAIELALSLPERIKSLTLVDPAGIVLPEVESIYHEFVADRNIFEITTPLQFKYFLNRVFFRPPLIPPFVWDHLYHEFSKHSKWHKKILNDLLEGVQSMDDPRMNDITLNRKLRDIKTPTMVVWGDEDSFFPAAIGHFVASQIPGARLYLLADRGHGPQVEAPYQFAQLLRKFMRSIT
ncbi:MAG: alpha/beta hydrolase [Proteobacteria bacterium]|nr:alpha/beta hydrolase [Pseudomonadota bacterium]